MLLKIPTSFTLSSTNECLGGIAFVIDVGLHKNANNLYQLS